MESKMLRINVTLQNGKPLETLGDDADPFAFLDDGTDPLLDTPAQSVARIVDSVTRESVSDAEAKDGIRTHAENCPKCGGSGRFHGYSGRAFGQCFKCKGTGKLSFVNSYATRQKAKAQRATVKARDAESALKSFAESNPIESAWIDSQTFKSEPFAFAVAMRDAIRKYGYLTANQLNAVRKLIARDTAREEERLERESAAKEIDTSALLSAFDKAAKALKSPRFLCGPFTVSKASERSPNAGALYVKASGVYLGKIAAGKFVRSRECTPEREAEFRVVCDNPREAAIRHGMLTGQCACCGRTLTNKESIERGIGPICDSKWFL